MSTQIANTNNTLPAAIADLFDADEMAEDLQGGVSGGFPILSIRGAKWRIKSGGEENPVLDDNDEPRPSVEVIIMKANKSLSKIYYEDNYSEGDAEAPTCFSTDGFYPDASSTTKQHENCAACPQNQWGSRITEAGKKAKQCHDNRRCAVVPSGDIENKVHGGPMLLRIPAASLGDLATFSKQLASKGVAYNGIVVRLGFDLNVSYPKLTFKAIRRVSEDEGVAMRAHFDSGAVDGVLSGEGSSVAATPATAEPEPTPEPEDSSAVDTTFEEEEVTEEKPALKSVPTGTVKKKAAAKKKAPAKKATAEPTKAQSSVEDELDAILGDLDSLG